MFNGYIGEILKINLTWLADVVRARRPVRLPVVMTPAETRALLVNRPNGEVCGPIPAPFCPGQSSTIWVRPSEKLPGGARRYISVQ